MVGLPGSGKSTLAHNLFADSASILSSDEYRKMLYGDENDQTHNAEVFNALYNDMRVHLSNGKNVIIDATNTTLKARKRIFDELKKVENINADKIAWVINTPIMDCIKFDSQRSRTVGENIIRKFEASFQFPQKFEGFNDIWIGDNPKNTNYPDFNARSYNAVMDIMCRFNQHNPHHIYSLGEHCYRLSEQCEYLSSEWIAGRFHDIGKLMTQSIDERGVAHYYNHDSVGTYYLASHLDIIPHASLDELLEILFFVNYHMRAHNDFKNPKAKRKYTALFGEDLYNRLIQFGEYDKIASGTYDQHEEIKILKF